jgi:Arabinose efflux permease
VCLPAKIEMQKASLVREFSVLKNPQVLMVLGISVLASASLFSTFTYITPILEDVSGSRRTRSRSCCCCSASA